MSAAVLVINAGSSSVKFAFWSARARDAALLLEGEISQIGRAPHFMAHDAAGEILADQAWEAADGSHEALFRRLLEWIDQHQAGGRLIAVGHRVVHGGARFASPVLIDDRVMRELEDLIPLAPLHQPHNLHAIRALAAAHPGLPQVACFDTAFHATCADAAIRFALPRALHDAGIRRYGFHGLSYESIARSLSHLAPDLARGRVVVAHLGNGASLCAMRGGVGVDTTMGFTALDGLPMGTRCGSLDPGVLLFMLDKGMATEAIRTLLYQQSGLLGVSGGIGSDMRDLLASNRAEAMQAVDLFVYRVVRDIGAMAACLGGVDGVVFTAGIGERSAVIRERICHGLAWLGIVLDPGANARGEGCITTAASRAAAWVIHTDEAQMIALHTVAVLRDAPGDAPGGAPGDAPGGGDVDAQVHAHADATSNRRVVAEELAAG
jgi:acetate kinase